MSEASVPDYSVPSAESLEAMIRRRTKEAIAAIEAIERRLRGEDHVETGIPQAQNPTFPLMVPESRADALEGCKVDAFSRRPYVVVMASHPVKGTVLGVAKVSHGDRWDPEHGLDIALTRAAREMGKRQ